MVAYQNYADEAKQIEHGVSKGYKVVQEKVHEVNWGGHSENTLSNEISS